MRYRIGQIVLLSGLLFSSGASAAISEPTFSPSTPQAGQVVTMVLQTDFCTSLTDASGEVDVSVQGNRIDVVIDAIHSIYSPCAGSPASYTFRLGQFPAGHYQVHITLRDAFPPEVFPSVRVASLTVVPPTKRVVIPATAPAALAFLAGILLVAARRNGVLVVAASLACVPPAAWSEAAITLSDPCPRGICDKDFVFADGYD